MPRKSKPSRRDDDFDDDDSSAPSWDGLYMLLSMLGAGFSQRAKHDLPFGQMPTPEMDKKCDAVFTKIIAGTDPEKMVNSCPQDVAAWCAARMAVASGVIFGYMQSDPPPPTEQDQSTMLDQMMISRWNAGMKQLWTGMFERSDGTIAFRGDDVVDYLQKQGKFFSGN